jgi:hypothetical protein
MWELFVILFWIPFATVEPTWVKKIDGLSTFTFHCLKNFSGEPGELNTWGQRNLLKKLESSARVFAKGLLILSLLEYFLLSFIVGRPTLLTT